MRRIVITLVMVGSLFAFVPAAHASSLASVSAAMRTVGDDLSAVSDAAGAEDAVALSEACATLQDDVEVTFAFTRPRAVSKRAWSLIEHAMSKLYNAGVLCESGADNLDAAQLRKATSLMGEGNAYITRASALM